MGQGVHWIIPFMVFALIGVAGTLYFRIIVMRRDESIAGLTALAAMSWREFIHLVVDALAQRGYTRVFNRDTPSGDDDYTLQRDGKHWLLACKHGSAYVLGSAAVTELGNEIDFANAAGGILVTQGRIADEAKPGAARRNIELLDGVTLWPELRERIKPQQLDEILVGPRAKAQRRIALSWLLALVAAIASFLLLSGGDVVANAGSSNVATSTPANTPAISAPVAINAAGLDAQRKQVAAAVSVLPIVGHAAWTTPSTLQVDLRDDSPDAMQQLCPLILRYDALATARIQLTPPAGSKLPTRFEQCRGH